MNKILLAGLIHLIAGYAAVVAAGPSVFDQANRQFAAGDFAGAAAAYEQILATDGPRAAVYYNLGNSYQRLAKYGPAILAYERARRITPRDPDLLANLAQARKAAAAFEDASPHPLMEAVLNYLSRNEWSWLVAGSTLVLGGLAVGSAMMPPPRRWLRQLAATATALACLAGAAGATALYLRRDEASHGVVLTDNATLRLSPFDRAEALGSPGPGRVVRIRQSHSGFHYVEVPGVNLHGWLAAKDVAVIAPE